MTFVLPSTAPRGPGDQHVERQIALLKASIQAWLEEKDLWFDCGFKDYLDHVGAEPGLPPVVLMLWFEGPLHQVLSGEDADGLEPQFRGRLEELGYWYENRDGVTIEIYPIDEAAYSDFASYFHWQWLCSLIEEDFADVYQELYAHFAQRPDDLSNLHWRDFEILLARTFQAQGFAVELGSGRGDEGVDIRLLQRDPIGDMLILVQAKRYGLRNKIQQQAVAALYGVGMAEGADRSLFVTTSTYAPVARRFAARVSDHLTLATSRDIAEWCASASDGVIRDKSSLVSAQHVRSMLSEATGQWDPRIVHAHSGVTMDLNSFALVIKETRHAALLMALPRKTLSDDGFGQQGYEIPLLDPSLPHLNADGVWRARRSVHDGRVRYWDGRHLYGAWDGKPCHFSLVD